MLRSFRLSHALAPATGVEMAGYEKRIDAGIQDALSRF